MKQEKNPKRFRLVLDTNVFVSGLISKKSSPGMLMQAFEKNSYTLLISDSVLAEYLRVLDYPKIRKYPAITDEAVSYILSLCISSALRIETESKVTKSPDEDDNRFLELAVDGKADMIVTGDKTDLLSLKEFEKIPIVTATQCLVRLGLTTEQK